MINKLICIYLDHQTVSPEVGTIINVNRYGDILYKKQKLKLYHRRLYAEAGEDNFINISKPEQITGAIEDIRLHPHSCVILHHSSFAVTNSEQFKLFIEKIKFLETDLSVADFDEQKPFMMLNSKSAITTLEKIFKSPENADFILEHEVTTPEKFKLEKFYKTLRNSVEFIEFLHTNFEARFFNSIEKDELYITKKSDKLKKIENEYQYYEFLPDSLKVFYLKPTDFVKTDQWCSYKLEKLNIPDVSIQWVHNSFTTKQFAILLNKLFIFLSKRPVKTLKATESTQVIESFYITKVDERIQDLKTKPEFISIAEIINNSTTYKNIDKLFELYRVKLNAILKKQKYEPVLALSHGDLCASNMLYDKRIDMLKLIDPRGADTPEGLYFDSYYDVAKLSHSIMGDYDLINNGLFDLEYDNNLQISLKLDPLANKITYQDQFKAMLEKHGYNYELVRIFEASLFLSMLPLHIDNPKKVLAFVLNAINILTEIPGDE